MDATQKFAWLVRAIRGAHPDPSVHDTSSFRSHFPLSTEIPAVGTINKLETGKLKFTIERCLAFEYALGLQRGTLVDVYCYTHRIHNEEPAGKILRIHEAGPEHLRLLFRLGHNDRLTPLEWLELAALYHCRPDLLRSEPKLHESISTSFFRDLATSYERDERLMLEAATVFGVALLPSLSERIRSDPTGLFNVAEVLGHIPVPESVRTLDTLTPFFDDDFLATCVLEAAVRLRQVDPALLVESKQLEATGRQFAVDCLSSGEIGYMTQEEAIAYLAPHAHGLTLSEKRRLATRGEEIAQLMLRPRGCSVPEILDGIQRQFMKSTVDDERCSALLAFRGLSGIVMQGLLSPSRRRRLAIGVLLSPWRGSGLVTEAVGRLLVNDLPMESYGIQRAAVRLITKLQGESRRQYLVAASKRSIIDDGLRCVLAWSLGPFDDDEAKETLSSLARVASLGNTKRAALVAAKRQVNVAVMATLAGDTDPTVATEARIALANTLGTRP